MGGVGGRGEFWKVGVKCSFLLSVEVEKGGVPWNWCEYLTE